MKNFMISFARDEQGQDLVEYALLFGLISLMSTASITAYGAKISQTWSSLDSTIGTVAGS